MIISDYVNVNVGSKTTKYYNNLGYECKNGDEIFVKYEHLTKGSSSTIEIRCDVCEIVYKTTPKIYNRYIRKNKSHDGIDRCRVCKSKKTLMDNYGVDCPMKSELIKNRVIKTNLERYGVEHSSMNDDVKNRAIKTNLERYGVEHPSMTEDFKCKVKNTKLERYGNENYNNIELIKETQTEKYGGMGSSSESISDKIKKTNIDKYGVDNVFKSEFIKCKIKKTMNDLYGVDHPSQSPILHNRAQISGFNCEYYNDTELFYRGTYELNFLEHCERLGIIDKVNNSPSINYIFGEKSHIYHPDFYIPTLNLIIEIKSDYYYNLYLDMNIKKCEYAKKVGYEYIVIINKNYDEFYKIVDSIL